MIVAGAGIELGAGRRVDLLRGASDTCGKVDALRGRADEPRRMVLGSLSADKTLGTPEVNPTG